MTSARLASTGKLRLRNGKLAQVTPGAASIIAASMAVAFAGQSNMVRLYVETYTHYITTNPLARCWSGGALKSVGVCFPTGNVPVDTPYSVWGSSPYASTREQDTPAGDGIARCVNEFTKALPIPLVIYECAMSSTSIESWMSNAQGSNWTQLATSVTASGKALKAGLWFQGEENSANGTSKTSYKASLGRIHDQYLALAGLTRATADQFYFGIVLLGPGTTYATEGAMGVIRQAQLEYIAENTGAYLAAVATDMSLTGVGPQDADGVIHFNVQIGQVKMGARYAASLVAWGKGAPVKWPGPKISGWSLSGTTATVATAGGVGALKDGAGGNGGALKGFRFFTGPNGTGSVIPYTTTAINGNDIAVTLSAAGAMSMDYGMANAPFGVDTTPASVLYDSAVVPGDTTGRTLIPCGAINVTGA